MQRKSGVLMHVSSLNGDYSVGSLGREAFEFIDFLAEGGFSYWQILPLCMTDECNSPYKSLSSFAGNPMLIDLPTLALKGLLTSKELEGARQTTPYYCEYDRLSAERLDMLRIAASRVADKKPIIDFIDTDRELSAACEFMALREANGGRPWYEWTSDSVDESELFFWKFAQYEFFSQWGEVKKYANSKGIEIIGDLPIYVALDSCDVWANKQLFLIDKDNAPTCVAGVPPDYFSSEGQLWGNPLYDWSAMARDGYAWWGRRISAMLSMLDGIRIDHFRALEAYWSIPAGAKSAKEGHWEKGPGKSFIDRIKEIAGEKLIIAEDLGDITDGVRELLEYSGFPGMRVLQFGFLGEENSIHMPHNYPKNCIAYTGTHDNNTLLGFIWESNDTDRKRLFDYCNAELDNWEASYEKVIKTVLASAADTVIVPIQDLLRFGSDTRMNIPGKPAGNWQYRITRENLESIDIGRYAYLNKLYGRI